MTFKLETTRLVLRPVEKSDAAFILELMNEPGYLKNIGDRGVRTVEDAEAYIDAKFIETYRTLDFGLWIAVSKAESIAIGICGFVKRDVLEYPDLGFAFLERFWSQGYGSESAAAALAYGRATLRLSQVYGVTSQANCASMRLLEKLEFTYDRTILLPGHAEQSLLFSLKFQPRTQADATAGAA